MSRGHPDEAQIINDAWNLITNVNPNTQSQEWRAAAKRWRDEYHYWLSYHIFTHPADEDDIDELSTGDLIDSLKLICPCGECNGAWVSRDEAEQIIERLKTLAIHDRDSSTAR